MVNALQIPRTIRHPCFDEDAHDSIGRVHLPVARVCNIQCNFCDRRVCANLEIQHPGWTAKLMTSDEATALVRSLVSERREDDFVVGVAGPGEPLANEETIRTLSLIHREFPWLMKCVSTNGLLLEERLPDLLAVGVKALTVTVNAPDGEVGMHIYSWVRYGGIIYRGKEAAEILITKQLRGIKAALSAGLRLKVNSVLVPGINDAHMVRLAARLKKISVPLMNIMPLIPGGKMKDLRHPTCDEIRDVRNLCAAAIPQFHRCEQCRADVIRLPGRQIPPVVSNR